jgi:hypothetical protein
MYQTSEIRTVTSKIVVPDTAGQSSIIVANVYTGATGAILKIYDGTSAGGTLIATIDASSKSSHLIMRKCETGIFLDLSVAAADCAITYQ